MVILFVCTGNTCRSPMAEVIARDFFKKNQIENEVISAGLQGISGAPASSYGIKAVEGLGLSLVNHESQGLNQALLEKADLIITMTKNHKDLIDLLYQKDPNILNKVVTLGYLASGEDRDVADPFMGSLAIYEDCRDELKKYIEKIKWEEL